MNIKKLALLSMLAFSAVTVCTETIVQDDEMFIEQDYTQFSDMAQLEIASEATMQEDAPAIPVKQIWNFWNGRWDNHYAQYLFTTIVPGAGVGYLTGTSIGYMSGTLFDAMAKPLARILIEPTNVSKYAPMLALTRLAAQIGSKWYWEKPLRHKLLNWIQTNIKSMYSHEHIYCANDSDHPVTEIMDLSLCNEECGKTLARLFAWLGLVSQVRTTFYVV